MFVNLKLLNINEHECIFLVYHYIEYNQIFLILFWEKFCRFCRWAESGDVSRSTQFNKLLEKWDQSGGEGGVRGEGEEGMWRR